MTRPMLVLAAAAAAGLASSSPSVHARQENQPGMPTIARVQILNRERAEAVPVKIQSTGDVVPVTVVGEPMVALAKAAVVGTKATRQLWEYRRLAVAASQDPTGALNAAGNEGWEAVTGTASGTEIVWTLKRPR